MSVLFPPLQWKLCFCSRIVSCDSPDHEWVIPEWPVWEKEKNNDGEVERAGYRVWSCLRNGELGRPSRSPRASPFRLLHTTLQERCACWWSKAAGGRNSEPRTLEVDDNRAHKLQDLPYLQSSGLHEGKTSNTSFFLSIKYPSVCTFILKTHLGFPSISLFLSP